MFPCHCFLLTLYNRMSFLLGLGHQKPWSEILQTKKRKETALAPTAEAKVIQWIRRFPIYFSLHLLASIFSYFLVCPLHFCSHTSVAAHILYVGPNYRNKEYKKPGVVQQPGVVGLFLELCYLFFSLLKARWACFQHCHMLYREEERQTKKSWSCWWYGGNKNV